MFGRGKELQIEVVPLSNLYNNKLDDFVNSLDKKDVIWQLVRNALVQSAKTKVEVASDSKLEEETIDDLVRDGFNVSISSWGNRKI